MELSLKNQTVAAIDADSICYIAHWDTINKSNDTKSLDKILNDVDSIISNILITTKATHYLGYLGLNHSVQRMEINPNYKSNRKNKQKLKYIDEIKLHMMYEWKFYGVENVEVDDVVSSIRFLINNVIICSPDKDIVNLPGTHYNYKKCKWINTTELQASYFFWNSMIVGDSADGIKGLVGAGPGFAEKLFKEVTDATLMRELVFNAYINKYGEYKGISEFYLNYMSLKLLDDYPCTGLLIPIKVNANSLKI